MYVRLAERFFMVCIDDHLFWAKNEADITQVALIFCDKGVYLEQEDYSSGFHGVKLERDDETGLIEMSQYGFIDRVIVQLAINDGATKFKLTPTEANPLANDEDGLGPSGWFSYSSMVGMMIFLS